MRHTASADSRIAVPYAGDRRAAIGAMTVIQAIGGDAETDAADDDGVARRTVRALQIADRAGDITRIDEPQPGPPADLVAAQELPRGRVRVLRHLIILMKGRNVPGDVAVDAGQELGDLRQLVIGIVEARHDQSHALQPDAALLETLDRIEHRLERPAEIAVVRVGETLQIDLVEIDIGSNVVEHLLRPISIRDVRADQSGPFRLLENFHG